MIQLSRKLTSVMRPCESRFTPLRYRTSARRRQAPRTDKSHPGHASASSDGQRRFPIVDDLARRERSLQYLISLIRDECVIEIQVFQVLHRCQLRSAFVRHRCAVQTQARERRQCLQLRKPLIRNGCVVEIQSLSFVIPLSASNPASVTRVLATSRRSSPVKVEISVSPLSVKPS